LYTSERIFKFWVTLLTVTNRNLFFLSTHTEEYQFRGIVIVNLGTVFNSREDNCFQ